MSYPATRKLKSLDLNGKRFGRLVVVSEEGRDRHGRRLYKVRCDCGVEKILPHTYLNSGQTRSCGCLKREIVSDRNRTHGMRQSPTYKAWAAMKTWCSNPNQDFYHRYGGRGITVCERWLHSFENFLADMGEKPEGMTLERKNSDGYYEPSNCVWATPKEQANNTSRNHYVEWRGETKTLVQWAEEIGLTQDALRNRLKRGWPVEKALTQPLRRW